MNGIVEKCNTDKAAILGLDGSVWSKSDQLAVTSEEIQFITKLFDNPSLAYAGGLQMEGAKYNFIRGTPEVLIAAKGNQYLLVSKANQCMLMCVASSSDKNFQGRQSLSELEGITNYLRENGY